MDTYTFSQSQSYSTTISSHSSSRLYTCGAGQRPSAYWFFVNRYFAFLTNIAVVVLANITLDHEIILIVSQVLIGVLLMLRVYALYNCSKMHLTYMVGSGIILAGTACYVMFGQKGKVAEVSGCHTGLSRSTAYRLAGAWEALFVFDTILFAFTLYKTFKERRYHRVTGVRVNLITLIIRDGCLYFAFMALCNLLNIMTFYFCPPYLRGGLSTFASCVSVTAMSRMMLNLHQTADEGIYRTAKTITQFEYANRVELDTIGSDVDYASPQDTCFDNPQGVDSMVYGSSSSGLGGGTTLVTSGVGGDNITGARTEGWSRAIGRPLDLKWIVGAFIIWISSKYTIRGTEPITE